VVVGFFIGYLIHHRSLPTWKLADTLLIFFFALPGTVIGIALVLFWNRPWMDLIYGTTAMVMIGYVIKYTALTSRITASSLARISPSLEEAGELAGLSWFHRLEKIVVPVVKRGIIAGWLITYIFCMRDIELTMIIYPAGGETLPVRISTLMANGAPELISALCVIMVIATLLPPAMIWFAAKNTFGDT
jgi:iron(III) transport system permease protein